MKVWKIWSEAFMDDDMEQYPVTFHGLFKGATFRDAVKEYAKTLPSEFAEAIDFETLAYKDSRFYASEADAEAKSEDREAILS